MFVSALISVSLHLYSKPICKVIAHQLPPLLVGPWVCTPLHMCVCVRLGSRVALHLPEPFWCVSGVLMEGRDYSRSWADSSMYLSADQVTDFMQQPRHATQVRGQEVLPNYPAHTALCLLAGAVAALHPDPTKCFLSLYTFICLSFHPCF